MRPFLAVFFRLLYSRLAWSYDFVAWFVSAGSWYAWVDVAVEDLPAGRILEIGHGTGHLIHKLQSEGQSAWAVDASRQMSRLARRRIQKDNLPLNLSRAKAQALPFPSGCFAAVLATFPSEYISDPQTLREINRVLQDGGMLFVVLSATIAGHRLPDAFAKWLFEITGQSSSPLSLDQAAWRELGFEARLEEIDLGRAVVARLVARKTN